ncbi:MAG: ABC transporter ATP-binding protein [Candidatus Wallacebacter cryptica]|jgi:ATP-binding cassette subfamily B protein|nr:ABC transporter ATP-binding protein [Bacillota bacterium]
MKKRTLMRIIKYIKLKPLYFISLTAVSLLSFAINYIVAAFFADMSAAMELGDLAVLLAKLTQTAWLLGGTALVGGISYYLLTYVVNRTSANFRTITFAKIQRLPASFLEENHSGDLTSRVTNDLKTLELVYSSNIQAICQSVLSGTAALAVMFIRSPELAAFTIGLGLIFTYLNARFAKLVRKLSNQVQERLGKLTERLSDLLAGMQTTRIYGLEAKMNNDYCEENRSVLALADRRVRCNAALGSVNFFTSFLSAVGLMIIGGFFVFRGRVGFGDIVFMVQMQNDAIRMFRSLGDQITQIQTGLAGAERVLELLDQQEEPVRLPKPVSIKPSRTRTAADASTAVEIAGLDFCYPNGEQVLRKLNLTVPKGQMYALVGPSGGGKSTILKLLLGFYAPSAGEIVIDGRPIYDLSLEELRGLTAYVPQESYLFTGTIAENIAYGSPNATMDQIEACARAAYAHDFIVQLPNGYDSKVGERGAYLSGGQRQRIAIARAILKDAPILLLDEATSALDSESEYLVQKALERLMVGRTTIAVAHRLSTVEKADRIVVINQGQVAESGTHSELLADPNSLYRYLHQLQYADKQCLVG